MVLENQKWTDAQFAKEMSAELHRALGAALRGGEPVIWPVASPVGEGRTQAVHAHPDGSWTLVDNVDREGWTPAE
jgi:D-hexose-6-phosphate mutarotase